MSLLLVVLLLLSLLLVMSLSLLLVSLSLLLVSLSLLVLLLSLLFVSLSLLLSLLVVFEIKEFLDVMLLKQEEIFFVVKTARPKLCHLPLPVF